MSPRTPVQGLSHYMASKMGVVDIAGPVAFLTSEDAAFVTGQALVVDGGQYKIS